VKVVAANTCTYVADPTGLPLAQVSAGQSKPAPVLLVVGPEGGLTETELRESVDAGAHLVNLGPRILRTETAALALVAALLLN
jgi:16S rRNA (uracil1498-N3)-methyltransferase